MKKVKQFLLAKGGWGVAEVLAMILGVVVVVIVLAPAVKGFAGTVTNGLASWWTGISAAFLGN